MNERQHIILCEGYDDRAFWCGWLLRLRCQDLSKQSRSVSDPWGRKVTGGQFGFKTPGGTFVRLQPCQGKPKLKPSTHSLVKKHPTNPIGRLLVSFDADDDATGAPTTSSRDFFADIVRSLDPEAKLDETNACTFQGIELAPVIWTCSDEDTRCLPSKQPLERLVVASIVHAHPDRGNAVRDWLDASPLVDGDITHKHFSLSHMAKWYTKHGCDAFYKEIWQEDAVREQLEARLRSCGAWQHVQDLADD